MRLPDRCELPDGDPDVRVRTTSTPTTRWATFDPADMAESGHKFEFEETHEVRRDYAAGFAGHRFPEELLDEGFEWLGCELGFRNERQGRPEAAGFSALDHLFDEGKHFRARRIDQMAAPDACQASVGQGLDHPFRHRALLRRRGGRRNE